MRHTGVLAALCVGYALHLLACVLSYCRGFLPWVLLAWLLRCWL